MIDVIRETITYWNGRCCRQKQTNLHHHFWRFDVGNDLSSCSWKKKKERKKKNKKKKKE